MMYVVFKKFNNLVLDHRHNHELMELHIGSGKKKRERVSKKKKMVTNKNHLLIGDKIGKREREREQNNNREKQS